MGNIDKDRIVCRCKKVSEGTVIEAIKMEQILMKK